MTVAYQKALDRILQCIETKNNILDLGGLALSDNDLPKELWSLNWLEELNFQNYYAYNAELKAWEDREENYEGKQLTPHTISAIPIEISKLSRLKVLLLGNCSISKIENLEKLTQLEHLSLESNQISKIENLENLTQLQYLFLGCNRISKIETVGNFPKLRYLCLKVNQINKIEKLESLLQLQYLDLSINKIIDIENLNTLTQLKNLFLRGNQISKIQNLDSLKHLEDLSLEQNQINQIENLNNLTKLQNLYLGFNQIRSLENLNYLTELKGLSLRGNKIIQIKNLENLRQLEYLYLGFNRISTINNLENLIQLKCLHLESNGIGWIKNLKISSTLQDLNLSSNLIRKIENLERFTQLQSLDLGHNKITKIENINVLRHLQNLYLDHNKITKIGNINRLYKLKQLSLSYNQITKIENLEEFSELKYLNLAGNQISKIENLESNSKIRYLLIGNQIEDITYLQNLKNLYCVDLRQNQIKDLHLNTIKSIIPPITVLTQNPIENVPDEIIDGIGTYFIKFKSNVKSLIGSNGFVTITNWVDALSAGSIQNKSIKIVLCGNGSVGKSSILDCLQKRSYDSNKKFTHAINLEKWTPDSKDIDTWVWDFGGQEIYHGTHRIFMQGQAVYVIVWDAESENKPKVPDRADSGLYFHNHKILYWVQTIRSVSPNSPIIVVQNKTDRDGRKRITEQELPPQYNVERFISVCAAEPRKNIDDLIDEIINAAKELKEYDMEVPTSWWAVREHILGLASNQLESKMSVIAFNKLCDKLQVPANTEKSLLLFLHRIGVVYYKEGFFKETIIINQQWAVNAIYTILDRDDNFYSDVNDADGYFSQRQFFRAIDKSYDENDKELLLEFMRGSGLCFDINDEQKKTPQYLMPRLLNELPTRQAEYYWQKEDVSSLYLKYQHDNLHYYYIQQFIVETGKQTYLDNLWRNGIHLEFRSETQAQIRADFINNFIEIKASGTFALYLMSAIVNRFTEINKKAKVQVLISCNGKQYVDRDKIIEENDKNSTNRVLIEKGNIFVYSIDKQKIKLKDVNWVLSLNDKADLGKELDMVVQNKEQLTQSPRMDKININYAKENQLKILMLTSNPSSQTELQIKEEHSTIITKLQSKQELFLFQKFICVSKSRFKELIEIYKPDILHFSGHSIDGKYGGIIVQKEDGSEDLITVTGLSTIFDYFKSENIHIKTVILNSCYSEAQAKAISKHVPYVIGTTVDIKDKLAIAFSAGFYFKLAESGSTIDIEQAFRSGIAEASMEEGANITNFVFFESGKKKKITS